jgi:hypothetical protein
MEAFKGINKGQKRVNSGRKYAKTDGKSEKSTLYEKVV